MNKLQRLNGRKLNKKEQQTINGGGVDCRWITCEPDYHCGQFGCEPNGDDDDHLPKKKK